MKGYPKYKGGPLPPIQWPQARWRVSCVPQGACLLTRGEWYWAVSYTEVWVVASDRQVMYWAPDKKTAVALKCLSTHSAVVQSFTSDTARAVAVYRSSGHAISQLLSRNKSVVSAHAQVARSGRKRRSPNFVAVALMCVSDTAQATHPFHQVIPYLSFCWEKFFFFFWTTKNFRLFLFFWERVVALGRL